MEHKTKRILYLIFGWFMFAIGFIGAFLPVLPTTPFMILALWGFSNGSETLHDWLYNHPRYGPTLRDWDQYRMIPVKAKITAVTMMLISATWMTFFSNIPNIALIIALGMMLWGAGYVLTKPSRPAPEPVPETAEQQTDAETPHQETIAKDGENTNPPEAP